MRRWLFVLLSVVGLALGQPPARAAAHPLGNFTVNQYSRLEVARDGLRLRYIVDMAEIPAFQERQAIDGDGDGQVDPAEQTAYLDRQVPALLAGLSLAVDGAPAALAVVERSLSFPPGQGGLPTLRLTVDAAAPLGVGGPLRVTYRDDNFGERLGWREIVVRPGEGVALRGATAPAQDQTDELRAYPQDLLSSPLDVRAASFTAVPAAAGAVAAAPAARPEERRGDAFAELIAAPELTPLGVGLALLLALLLGAGHGLTPGHGKTIVAAYLIGARGTARHAVFLGLTTTITHTLGVFLLGFITLFVANYVLPERIYPWLELASGVIVVGIGLTLFRSRLSGLLRPGPTAGQGGPAQPHGHHHHGAEGHDHDHGPHGHSHLPPGGDGRPVTWRSLLALGVSGGLLPCPSALVVLLGAIALNRVALGMLLIVAFSLGLASVLTGIGLLLVYARRLFERFPTDGWLLRALPLASAAAVTLAGTALTVGSLAQVGL